MSQQWIQAAVPVSFWIRKDFYRCRACGTEYACVFANGNEIVKFSEDGGHEVRWLPTFEVGGYLDLMERLVAGYRRDQKITMPIAKKFESEFKKIQELSASGNTFSVAVGCRCPKCSANNAEIILEEVFESPPVDWLRYS
jgi:uncharacterized protein with PIN domain